jgi:hypothetical protein
MSDVSTFRLYLLRAMYVFIAVGLAVTRWPEILNPPADASHMDNVVRSMLGAFSLLALLGIRYPIRMLPLLFFELVWKSMWVLMWGLDDQLTPDQQETLVACLMGIIPIPLMMPWRYVINRYVKAPGDPWRKQMTSSTPERPSSSPSAATTSSHP